MLTFLKAQTTAMLATGVDFLVTIVVVETLGVWYVLGTMLGTISGGVFNFSVNRKWVFQPENKSTRAQGVKYMLVWLGSMLLNAAGVYVLTHYTGLVYIASKVVTAVFVGVGYNYQLQKKFVFR
ncbi:GtrA family protein [Nibribacter ruber]|uniref:GtrA family protein n=1 Tax=Nibribacter ruber TaxID=2698458 RepID=A0A6P1P3Q6_9BACT|nr:GtrA family protein [Nibribacter ruber]QHL89084.1 GtrA family protein [Nibribacter ruber]